MANVRSFCAIWVDELPDADHLRVPDELGIPPHPVIARLELVSAHC
jgi:hypothetical protein